MSQYTKEQRRDLKETFQMAANAISDTWEGCNEYICHTLEYACEYGRITKEQLDLTKGVILERIAPHITFQGWLLKNGVSSVEHESDRITNRGRKLQATRKAWLLDLVKEFSK